MIVCSCCTINRDPLQTIIPTPISQNPVNLKLPSEEFKEKKTSVCMSKKILETNKKNFIFSNPKIIKDESSPIDMLANIDYGNFVKRRHGSIQNYYKFDQKSLGQGRLAIFFIIQKISASKAHLDKSLRSFKRRQGSNEQSKSSGSWK